VQSLPLVLLAATLVAQQQLAHSLDLACLYTMDTMTVFEAPLLVLPVYTALTVMNAKHFPAAFSAACQGCWELPLTMTVSLKVGETVLLDVL